MKISTILLQIIFLFSGSLVAQNEPYDRSLPGYFSYASEEFGITCKKPEKFADLNQYFSIRGIRGIHKSPTSGFPSGFIYGPVFQSKDKECILMYPALPWYILNEDMEWNNTVTMINRAMNNDTSAIAEPDTSPNHSFPRSQVISEMKAAVGLFDYYGRPLHDSISFDFNEHVTIIAGKKAREMFNADSIYIYDLPLEEPYLGKYTYRTGMVISKKDRATMIFKWFFTPKGKKKEDEYIEMLSKQIWYEEDFSHDEE